jgi:UDP-N-acetylmuramate dehydrogenase
LSGIPGQVGATPIQNVGAYGQEVADCLESVDVYDCELEQRVRLHHSECAFGYRTSRFKASDAGRFIVVGTTFRLHEGGPACLSYPEIAQHFAPRPGKPAASLRSVRDAVLATRRLKSMLLEPRDENSRSCGSFFLNPQLTSTEFEQLCERCATRPPAFSQTDGRVKVPAAWLIDQAGFQRGQRFGPVGISSRHTLALVCHAGATTRHLLEAAHRVRDGVARAFAITLTPEPRFLGFGPLSEGLPTLE